MEEGGKRMPGTTMSGTFVLLEQPSGAWRPRMALRLRTLIFAMFAVLLPMVALAQQLQVFYATGSDGQSKGNNLYEVDKATLRAVRSVDAGGAQSGMLTGKGHTIVLTD